jgi:hypothetical protein
MKTLGRTFLVVGVALVASVASDGQQQRPQENRLPDDVQAVISRSQRLELLSLDPKQLAAANVTDDARNLFHGWRVLGRTPVDDPNARRQVIDALNRSIQENKGLAAACFVPRHGLRASAGGRTVDLVICFQCFQIRYYDGQAQGGVLTTASSRALLNRLLRQANVPLAQD